VGDSYLVDLDADGEPVGVELLNVLADAQAHARDRRVRLAAVEDLSPADRHEARRRADRADR
jgi:hypothetical protein